MYKICNVFSFSFLGSAQEEKILASKLPISNTLNTKERKKQINIYNNLQSLNVLEMKHKRTV